MSGQKVRKHARAAAMVVLQLMAKARADDAPVAPTVTVQAVRPDRQAAAVLGLFEGSRASSPAAAMAAWRRATRDHTGLGKPAQAVAAIFNPEMVAEWRAFHDAELVAGIDRAGVLQWFATVPNDDGAIAALVTSLRLSGGDDLAPIGEPPLAVERLGAAGAPLAAVSARGTAFASRKAELAVAVDRLKKGEAAVAGGADLLPLTSDDSGFRIVFDPAHLPAAAGDDARVARLAAGARGAGLERTIGFLRLREDHLDLDLASRFDPARRSLLDTPPIDPGWLSWMPADATRAAAAFAVGSGADYWDAVFDLADRLDRADPARARLQPVRVRLNLLATVRGIRPEVDLWPLIRGVSAGTFADPGKPGRITAVIALHAERPEDAERISRRVVQPALAGNGRVAGEPVETVTRGASVLVGWGEGAIATALKSAEAPENSVAALVRAADGRPTCRAGIVRPGLVGLPFGGEPNSPLAATLTEAAPVVWRGGWEGGRAWDLVRWGDLRRSVARFLERVPQAPPETP